VGTIFLGVIMGNISNPYSGKRSFFKGAGRKGNKKLDKFQRMLIRQERINYLKDSGIPESRYSEFYFDDI
jgi:hypothetical protein